MGKPKGNTKGFMNRGQLVGYRFEEKQLVVTMSDKMAEKMKTDGWHIQHESEIGHFVTITLKETE
jgi:hypothetical protein